MDDLEQKRNKGWECTLCDVYSLGDKAADRLIEHWKTHHTELYKDGLLHIIAIRWNHPIPDGREI